VTEDGDGIFDRSDVRQDGERQKLKMQDYSCRVELNW
jgi:hypothetical protein